MRGILPETKNVNGMIVREECAAKWVSEEGCLIYSEAEYVQVCIVGSVAFGSKVAKSIHAPNPDDAVGSRTFTVSARVNRASRRRKTPTYLERPV